MSVTVSIPVQSEWVGVFGAADRNLKMIRESLGVKLVAEAGGLRIQGENRSVSAARSVVERLDAAARKHRPMSRQQVLELISDEAGRAEQRHGAAPVIAADGPMGWTGELNVSVGGQRLRPRSDNQRAYLEAIRTNDLVFGLGPAGTGKTYLAVASAVQLLRQDMVRKIVLVRPAVEAGEKLGFLPGGLEEKVNPYLRPLLDALHDMLEYQTIKRFLESDVLEIAPLAFMRGRTLNGSVVILDEAQNTTRSQMQMFLTRLGHGSKMIVTGDVTQIDLPDPGDSGLIDAVRRLRRVAGVGVVSLEGVDVVRHAIVQRVVDAYGLEPRDRAQSPRSKTPGRTETTPKDGPAMDEPATGEPGGSSDVH